jgi:transcription antitermination factor NusA-like protein
MKICQVCINNDILCNACNSKLEKGTITKLDVFVSRALKKQDINADFENVIEDTNIIIVLADKENSSKLIGKGGMNAKKLEKHLGKKVRVIEKGDKKTMAEKILNAPVIGINVLYAGEEKYRIRLDKSSKNRMKETMFKMLEKTLGKKIEVVYE